MILSVAASRITITVDEDVLDRAEEPRRPR